MELLVMTSVTALVSSIMGALVGAFVSKLKTIRSASEDAKREHAELMEIMEQNIVMTCRMAIYDNHFSVDEKLDAYEIYRAHGGNHQTKQFMDQQLGCDVDEYIERHRKKD